MTYMLIDIYVKTVSMIESIIGPETMQTEIKILFQKTKITWMAWLVNERLN